MKCHSLMLVAVTTLILASSGCRSVPARDTSSWGEASDGLRCRLYVEDYDPQQDTAVANLVLEIQNTGEESLRIPAWQGGDVIFPSLRIAIAEEPDVRSPAKSGGASPSVCILDPGATFSLPLRDAYFVAYGTYKHPGKWKHFVPEDMTYHLTATIKIDAAATGLNDAEDLEGTATRWWSGKLTSNTIAMNLKH